ncbi:MAG: lysophospholipid acyltransferase family protein [Acidobacteriota bacterium]
MLTRLRHRVEYAVVMTVRYASGVLPVRLALALGSMVGLVFHAIDGSHRRLAVSQLRAAFPMRSEAECRAIARQTFIHFGRSLVMVLRVSTLTASELLNLVDVEGEDRIQTALAAGNGAIVFSGHFGYWELHGLVHALVLAPMSVLARPLDNPYLHGLLERMRRATGNQVIYRQGALRRVLRALQSNECVAILIDQHIHGADAVPVDFFGRPAATTAALATLALRTGAPLVPAFAIPLPDGRCRLVYEHPVEMPATTATDPVLELTQRCTDVLEMYVRRYPHLWLWMHRRWRDLPATADPSGGMFPTATADENESMES